MAQTPVLDGPRPETAPSAKFPTMLDQESPLAGVGVRDPELVIGVVTPVGTNTGDFVARILGALAEWGYSSSVIKLSALLDSTPPSEAEHEDDRITRLIQAGNTWSRGHASSFGLAPLAIREIGFARAREHERRGLSPDADLAVRPLTRHAYILHSLKRPGEVELLRYVYGEAFLLFATQAPLDQRVSTLMDRLRTHHDLDDERRRQRALQLVEIDAKETDKFGQDTNKTYTMADVFVPEDRNPDREIAILFGDSATGPTIAEYAMSLAQATAARSLVASRRVGAAIVKDQSVIALGMNDVPNRANLTPDSILGYDFSVLRKQDLAIDTIDVLLAAGWISDEWVTIRETDRERFESELLDALAGSQIDDIIEFQRAVHAEMYAILDAAERGVALNGAEIYCTTYPCHLCWKHIFSVGIKVLYYIDLYPKSQASRMYAGTASMLRPYVGVAPHKYARFFQDRKLLDSDRLGRIEIVRSADAQPLVGEISAETMLSREARTYNTTQPGEGV